MADEVDACIDRLQAAVRAAGVDVPDSPGNLAALAALEREVAPLRLPASLRRVWERVSPANLPAGPSPASPEQLGAALVADPAIAFHGWISARDFPGPVPVALVAAAYWPPVWRFVELATDDHPGGAVLDWSSSGDGFRPRFESVEAWLDATTHVIEEGGASVERWVAPTGWLSIDGAHFEAPAAGERSVREWPERWRAAVALCPSSPAVEEQSVSEVLWSLPRRGAVSVSGLVGAMTEGERGQRLRVTDGTGLLDVWCPASTPELSLLRRHHAYQLTIELGISGWEPDAGQRSPAAQRLEASPPHGVVTQMRVRMFG